MPASKFQRLVQHSIAIELEVRGRSVQLSGIANYERQSDLGAILRVHVVDPAGDFDLILREDTWKGEIVSGGKSGSDFRIILAASNLITKDS